MMLNQKVIRICLLIVLSTVSCKSNPATKKGIDSTKSQISDSVEKPIHARITSSDDTIYNLIGKIDEVIKFIEKTNKTSTDKKVSVMIIKKPDNKFVYYWVQVGVDDRVRFQPVYNFYVHAMTYDINYYDTGNDSLITIDKWRKTRSW